jgi:hypothetical protein
MFPKKVCKLEITEDRYGEKTVQYPNCNKDIFLLPGECKSFEDCYEKISDGSFKTKFAVGAHVDTYIYENDYGICPTRTSLVIPKDTIVMKNGRGGLCTEGANLYVYSHTKSCKWANGTLSDDSNFRYQNNGTRIFEIGKEVKMPHENTLLFFRQ